MPTYRKLTQTEIEKLQRQGCSAEDWNTIQISCPESIAYISNAFFSGEIRIGQLGRRFEDNGITQRSSIRNARMHNCIVGDNVTIYNINSYIANYTIEDNCIIGNVNQLNVNGETSFGNGTEVAVLNETGGREVPIFDRLSAHLAYITALYRYRPELIEKIKRIISCYCTSVTSDRGTIGKNSKITNCNIITNVRCGEYTTIDGTELLLDGTILSNEEAPTRIGNAVIAKHFICCSGSSIDDGSIVIRSFVGQASQIGQLFSAHDSLFFANCQAYNGEACAIFAGPYTVTAHKSSLLISGMFSFLNAGSGSNQSNHMYKLGPIHQGVVDRGSKTTSDSYILWPARIGPFSLVMGRHVSNTDSSDLPFSYLIENKNKTYIYPGTNLKSVGTIRDSQKWPKRDRRADRNTLDFINFNLLSPYTTGKMIRGVHLLQNLMKQCGENSERYTYRNCFINNSSARKGIGYYTMAIDKFFGNSIIKKLEGDDFKDMDDMRNRLKTSEERGRGQWIDLAGLIVPKSAIENLLNEIEGYTNRYIDSNFETIIDRIHATFEDLHRKYYEIEWTWASEEMQKWYGVDFDTITAEGVKEIVGRWENAVLTIDGMLYEDAKKEFSLISKTGFGVDGSTEKDFKEVRGSFDENPFVKMVLDHMKKKKDLGEELIARLNRMGK